MAVPLRGGVKRSSLRRKNTFLGTPMIDRYKKLIFVNFPDCMIEREMRFIQLEYCK